MAAGMRRLVILAVVMLTTARARAAPVLPPGDPGAGRPFAIAVNLPFAWPWSFAASAWLGVDDHQAIRANFARYRGPLWQILPNLAEADGEDDEEGAVPPNFGATTDLGLGWVYYPRRALDGPCYELGALLRLNRLRDQIDDHNVAAIEQFTNVYSVRALAGWNWRMASWAFIAAGLGASAGYERGRHQSVAGYDHGMTITRDDRVSRRDVSVEAYLRFGLSFGR